MDGFKANPKMKSDLPCYRTGGLVNKKAEGGRASKSDEKQDKAIVKKAFKQHDKNLHGGKKEELKLKKGGKADGEKCYAKGGSAINSDMKKRGGSTPAKRVSAKPGMAKTPSEASAPEVPPFGQSPVGGASGSAPATMGGGQGAIPGFNHGGVTINHHHYHMGGSVRGYDMGGMVAPGGGSPVPPGVGAPDPAAGAGAGGPQLDQLKKRLQMLAQQGGGGAGGPDGSGGGMPPQGAAGVAQAAPGAPQGNAPGAIPGMGA